MATDKKINWISWLRNLNLFLIFPATSVIISLGSALSKIRANDYISLGFWKTIVQIISDRSAHYIIPGILAGLIFLAVKMVWVYFLSRRKSIQNIIKAITPDKRPYLVCMGVIFFILLVHLIIYDSIGILGLLFLAILGSFWSLVFFLYRRISKTSDRIYWFQGQAFRTDFYAGVLLLITFLPLFDKSQIKFYLFVPEMFMAFCLVIFLLVLVLTILAPLYTRDTAVYSTKRNAGRALLPALILLIISFIPLITREISPTGLQPKQPWNVILIGIDTLRSDRTTLLGPTAKGRELTPNLKALAARGTIFANAISQSSWTLPSFSSMFTGKYPYEHGAIQHPTGTLRDRETTLSEIMREAGYLTGGIISNYYVSSSPNFDQGFMYFNEKYMSDDTSITSRDITNEAISFLDRHGDQNFFLFVHYFDPHADYQNHAEWTYADYYHGWVSKNTADLPLSPQLLSEQEIEYLTDAYDEEVAFTDMHIGRLLDYINQSSWKDKTMLVVVADHGEEFNEHNHIGHIRSFYREVLHVPLIIVLPETRHHNAVVDKTVETRAIYSSILDFVGLPAVTDNPPASLLPYMTSEPDNEPGYAFTVYDGTWRASRKSAIWTDDWRLFIDHDRQQEFLFDVKNDPREKTNLILAKPDVHKELRLRLDAWLAQMAQYDKNIPVRTLNQDEIDRLKSLGYL
ncbi:MAG: sulfatase [Sedimentisphaerales bacterium]|nr:sulfatase [Sedimentisphaerales bacterium]